MDHKTEVSEFLVTRRARMKPERAGLPAYGGNRRVPGLRREDNPYDRGLTDLIGELSTRSELFRTLWASHDVRFHRTGVKTFHHPVVGRIEVAFEAFDLPADPGLTMVVYSAEPRSTSEDALKLFASWTATRRATPATAVDRA